MSRTPLAAKCRVSLPLNRRATCHSADQRASSADLPAEGRPAPPHNTGEMQAGRRPLPACLLNLQQKCSKPARSAAETLDIAPTEQRGSRVTDHSMNLSQA
jgi:hypothetical protein